MKNVNRKVTIPLLALGAFLCVFLSFPDVIIRPLVAYFDMGLGALGLVVVVQGIFVVLIFAFALYALHMIMVLRRRRLTGEECGIVAIGIITGMIFFLADEGIGGLWRSSAFILEEFVYGSPIVIVTLSVLAVSIWFSHFPRPTKLLLSLFFVVPLLIIAVQLVYSAAPSNFEVEVNALPGITIEEGSHTIYVGSFDVSVKNAKRGAEVYLDNSFDVLNGRQTFESLDEDAQWSQKHDEDFGDFFRREDWELRDPNNLLINDVNVSAATVIRQIEKDGSYKIRVEYVLNQEEERMLRSGKRPSVCVSEVATYGISQMFSACSLLEGDARL